MADKTHLLTTDDGKAAPPPQRLENPDAPPGPDASFEWLAETIDEGIWITDRSGATTYANRAVARMLATTPAEMAGRSMFDWVAAVDMAEARRQFEQRRNGTNGRFELRLRRSDGQEFWAHFTASSVKDASDRFVGVLRAVTDITERKAAEEALRQSEMRLAEAQHIAQLGSWSWDVASDSVHWSDEACRIYGISPDGRAGQYADFLARLHPEDRDRVARAVAAALSSGMAYDAEHRIVRPSGEIRVVHARGRFTRDPRGGSTRLFGTIQDTTDRRRAAFDLEVRTYALASSIFGIAMCDLGGQMTYANRAFLQMWGYDSEDQVLGRPSTDFWLSPDQVREIRRILTANQPWVGEMKARRKDGSLFDLYLACHAVHDRAGRHVCFAGSFIDITDRKHAEAALRESEDRYRRIVETAEEGVWILDRDFRTTFANQKMGQMLGHTPGELVGRSVFDFVPQEDRTRAESMLNRRRQGIREQQDFRFVRRDGSDLFAIVSTNPILDDDGTFRGCLGMVTDVTDRRRTEESLRASEKLAATGRMAARIAHEINNPLAGIKNSFRLVRDAVPQDHPDRRFVGLIEREIDRIAGIVRQMFDLYRNDGDSASDIDLAQAVREVVSLVRSAARERRVDLRCDLPSAIVAAHLPEAAVRQVLFNLLQNALDASPEGGEVVIALACPAFDRFELRVTDRGAGIPDALRSRIFEPFFTTKMGKPGTGLGLGLSISQRLIESFGGSLDFSSEPGAGTTFCAMLPAKTLNREPSNA